MMKPSDFDPVHEAERAQSALWSLDAGCPRPEWVRLGMAAKAAGLDFEDWHQWSATAGNYQGERDCRATWQSMKGEGIGPGTLFAAARAAGWPDLTARAPNGSAGPVWPSSHLSSGQPVNRLTEDAPERIRTAAVPITHPGACMGAAADPAAVWSRFTPAPADHPYLTRKGMPPDGLRVVPRDAGLRIAGHDCAGWLALPVWNIERAELQSIQFVSPEAGPPELSLPGCRIAAGALAVHPDAPEGRMTPEAFAGGVAYLAEGAATAASLYQATGRAAVATFGKGNVDTIARALRQRYPVLRIVLCPDRGAEPQAAAIAAGLGGPVAWIELPEDCPPNFDANDYAAAHGLDGVAELLKAERTPPQRFNPLSASELANRPPVRWRVRGVLPMDGIAAIYGPPGCGKSFLALDLLAAVAAGRAWFDCRVKPAPVLYIGLEGEAGIAQRVRAHQARHGIPEGMRFLLAPLDLRQPQDRADIVQAARANGLAGGVLCIDTLAASAPGMDENAGADMGEIIAALKALQTELGGLVLAAHHTGKDATKGLRGHSSLLGALDAAVEVARTDDRREWRTAKAKDASDGAAAQRDRRRAAGGRHLMGVTDLLDQAADAGVSVILDGERIGLRGDPIAVRDWAPRLRPHRDELLVALRQREAGRRKHWTVAVPGRQPFGIACVQGTTRTELLTRYPPGTIATNHQAETTDRDPKAETPRPRPQDRAAPSPSLETLK